MKNSDPTATRRRWDRRAARWLLVILSAVGALGMAEALEAQESAGFKVIVNQANPTTEVSKSTLAKIFIKKSKRWEQGEEALPVDQQLRSDVRAAFSQEIHGKSVNAINAYWQRMIFSGRNVPPTELASDQEVLRFVAREVGAVGYVRPETELIDGVKELTLTE